MISKRSLEKDHILSQINKYPNVDPAKMEMTIYAFCLLEELIRSGVPLIFKGGTSLLLLLSNPRRVSTDIDIIVPRDFDFDKTFEKVKTRFPFFAGEERAIKPNSLFRHFNFIFKGPVSERNCYVNLDVAFEDIPYSRIIEKPIYQPYLEVNGDLTYVNVPSISSILGDKLTAFAPNTIGVSPFFTSLGKPIDNRLQVMKQFYDCARLIAEFPDENEVMSSYRKCQNFENRFRGTTYSILDTLLDTFNSSALIASKGQWDRNSSFYEKVARQGIQGLSTNIFDASYRQIDAVDDAAKTMYFCACLISDYPISEGIKDSLYKGKLLQPFKSVGNAESFGLIRKALTLLTNKKVI